MGRRRRTGVLVQPGERRKQIADNEINTLEPAPGSDMVPLDGEAGFATVLGGDFVPGTGPDAVWRRTEHGGLVGRPLADLTVAGEANGEDRGRAPRPHRGPGRRRSAHRGRGPYGARRGPGRRLRDQRVVAAVAPASRGSETEFTPRARALRPDTFDASNELTAYLVDGAVGDERLQPLRVAGG